VVPFSKLGFDTLFPGQSQSVSVKLGLGSFSSIYLDQGSSIISVNIALLGASGVGDPELEPRMDTIISLPPTTASFTCDGTAGATDSSICAPDIIGAKIPVKTKANNVAFLLGFVWASKVLSAFNATDLQSVDEKAIMFKFYQVQRLVKPLLSCLKNFNKQAARKHASCLQEEKINLFLLWKLQRDAFR
jgi:hypothetical protein